MQKFYCLTGSNVETYKVTIDDSVSTLPDGCCTMYVKKTNGILQTEEYISDSDCSDVVPVYVRCFCSFLISIYIVIYL